MTGKATDERVGTKQIYFSRGKMTRQGSAGSFGLTRRRARESAVETENVGYQVVGGCRERRVELDRRGRGVKGYMRDGEGGRVAKRRRVCRVGKTRARVVKDAEESIDNGGLRTTTATTMGREEKGRELD